MSMTTEQKLEGECHYHISPPCEWCLSLTEDEADAFTSGGREAVMELLDAKLESEGQKP